MINSVLICPYFTRGRMKRLQLPRKVSRRAMVFHPVLVAVAGLGVGSHSTARPSARPGEAAAVALSDSKMRFRWKKFQRKMNPKHSDS